MANSCEKEVIRGKMKSLRQRLSRDEVLEKSRMIKKLLFELPEFIEAETISFYVAKQENYEVETEDMIKTSLQENKRVLVPAVSKKNRKLIFCELKDYDRELELGTFNVLEPKPSCRRVHPKHQTDLIIVPSLAFDFQGYRLGYGGGYYDRFLREIASLKSDVPSIGLAYEFQILDKLPRCPYDMAVDKIITEDRVLHVGSS